MVQGRTSSSQRRRHTHTPPPQRLSETALPSTPEPERLAMSAHGKRHDNSPCIYLHGEPLNTPAKVHYGLIKESEEEVPDTSSSMYATDVPRMHVGKRKNSFQRAVDVNKETIQNTKTNSGYTSIEIVKEVVRLDIPRPPSPSTFFLKVKREGRGRGKVKVKTGPQEDIDDETAKRSVRFAIDEPTEAGPNDPPFYDTEFPLKPALKPIGPTSSSNVSSSNNAESTNEKDKKRLTVKKIIYADDEEHGLIEPKVSVSMRAAKETSTASGGTSKDTLPRINGPARRIFR